MTPAVVVANGGKNHAYHTAMAAQRAKYLKYFVTVYYYKPYSFSGRLLVCTGKKDRLVNRRLPDLADDRVKSIWWPEAAARLLKKTNQFGGLRVPWLYMQMVSFDWAAARYAVTGNVFHGFVTCALFSLQKAKKIGIPCILDLSIMHPFIADEIVGEEMKRHGLFRAVDQSVYLTKRVCSEISLADRILVASQTVWDSCVRAGVKESKLQLVPYGYDQRLFKPIPKSDKCFRVLFVGSLLLRKGIEYLLEAFRQLALPNSELLLIGARFPESKELLREYAGVYRHISHVPAHELYRYFSNASVFVLPSLVEGSALVTYEAMACALPLIVTQNAGSIVRDEQDGFLIPIRDVGSLKDRLLILYADEQLRSEMGKSGMHYVQNFTWETYYQRLRGIYDTLS